MTLALPEGSLPEYRPGQYMNILLPDGRTRSFSMASPPVPTVRKSNSISAASRAATSTDTVLARAAPGMPLHIQAPLGAFCYHPEDYRPLLMVATGTGLAPIKAILESLLDDPDCPPVSAVLQECAPKRTCHLRDVIESWKERLYEFEFVPVLSRAGPSWQGRRGQRCRMRSHRTTTTCPNMPIYVCGSPDMVAEAKAVFATLGASLEHLYADSFTFQQPVTAG